MASSPPINLPFDQISWNGLFPQPSTSDDAFEFAYVRTGKTSLVTGAGGSIGSALAKTIRRFLARCLLLIDSSEQALYRIHSNLTPAGSQCHAPILGSLADERCLRDTFQRCRREVVYHAAAFKNVPLTEMNPFAVATSALALLAHRFDVARLIMISTDKAVDPESVMGAAKGFAELVLLSMLATAASMGSIRFGNVPGSEGSVVPLFLEQIARGGPVTITDPGVKRYFLTMKETVQHALAGAASCPGDGATAILVMGAPIRIVDLVRHPIAQAPAKDVEITYTGLHPGDKLKEQFVSDREAVMEAAVDGVRWVDSPSVREAELAAGLAELNTALDETDLSQLLTASRAWCRSPSPAHFISSKPAFPWLTK